MVKSLQKAPPPAPTPYGGWQLWRTTNDLDHLNKLSSPIQWRFHMKFDFNWAIGFKKRYLKTHTHMIHTYINTCTYAYTYYMDRVKRIWYLSPMRAAKVQASSESRGTFRQKARSLVPLNGWACAVKICHDGMLEDTNSLDGAHILHTDRQADIHTYIHQGAFGIK